MVREAQEPKQICQADKPASDTSWPAPQNGCHARERAPRRGHGALPGATS